jgi:hypothetical protein
MAAMVVASCGNSTEDKPPESVAQQSPQAASASAPREAAAGADPCSLLPDPAALFGQPVTATNSSMQHQKSCEWKSADGRLCGSVTIFTPAFNSSTDPKVNFAGLVKSMGAFGEVKDLTGIAEEAKIVDGGMFGAQVAVRTASQAALAASACKSGSEGSVELAQKLAREIAGRL